MPLYSARGQQQLQLYCGRDTFEFEQGHVTKNPPIAVLVLLRESLGIYQWQITYAAWVLQLINNAGKKTNRFLLTKTADWWRAPHLAPMITFAQVVQTSVFFGKMRIYTYGNHLLFPEMVSAAFAPYRVCPFEFAPTLYRVRPHTFRSRGELDLMGSNSKSVGANTA